MSDAVGGRGIRCQIGRTSLRSCFTGQLRSSTASWYRALHVSQRADALHWIVHWSCALLRFFSISIATMFVHLVVPRFVSVCWRLILQKQYLEFCVGGGALMILMFFFRDLLLWMSFALSYFFRRSYI